MQTLSGNCTLLLYIVTCAIFECFYMFLTWWIIWLKMNILETKYKQIYFMRHIDIPTYVAAIVDIKTEKNVAWTLHLDFALNN